MSDRPLLTGDSSASEALPVAYEMFKAYRSMVDFYRKQEKLSLQDALARADERLSAGGPEYEERLRNEPPQESSWWRLKQLIESDPDAFDRRWQAIKQAALDE